VSDERDSAGSAGDGTDETANADSGKTAVVTPQRPTGKRTRREVTGDTTPATETGTTKNGDGKKPKTTKKDGPGRNPIAFVFTFLKQVVAELRKVIWPGRRELITYTTVVIVFVAFIVALVAGLDLLFAQGVIAVFG
jgi:preprotein translocase subunit SecE